MALEENREGHSEKDSYAVTIDDLRQILRCWKKRPVNSSSRRPPSHRMVKAAPPPYLLPSVKEQMVEVRAVAAGAPLRA